MPSEALTVDQLDEKALLGRIFPRLGPDTALLGPGDDAAVIAAPDGRTVISIDTLVQDADFRLLWPSGYRTTGFDVGWKCVAQNVSDIRAMGAVPTSLVVSLTLPGSTEVAWVEELAAGLAAGIDSLAFERCSVVGGDLGRGSQIVVTAAVTGDLEGRNPVLRSGARPGDVLAHIGSLGLAAGGLAVLESNVDMANPGDSEDHVLAVLAMAQCRPRPPRTGAGPEAAIAGATAMLDVSDGLVRDAGRIARASGMAIDLDAGYLASRAEQLAPAAARLGADPLAWVLGGGEDHGLLATFPPDAVLPEGFVRIGEVTDGAGVTFGGEAPPAIGWDHFAG
ncbi:thiamine-phosphate kinase [Arthrobacter sp. zg-Y859]|uniref:Thiamine-monophosphate kinase n=1 Tax=Arthrobacter jinronghuae TaxID=2964609 RepID=A0ABT1NS93_9MICC|nr:thiamine-phosphate kinase [Arthrobacter jinronghuae]MCQ1950598.1 thiamine-phosphate kinase [Arthrobacter jinronghuae]MCQ1956244.1 thiamine-phosphate kinase [Arthrobacter jinronghuae]UWX77562.1 thiamine-phosphate kinase [Arthrobacter jinronghuae]